MVLVVLALAMLAAPASALATSGVADWGTSDNDSLGVPWEGGTEAAPQPNGEISDPVFVTGGWHTNYAIMPNGTVKAWGGANEFAQLGDGTKQEKSTAVQVTKLEHITQISASGYHAMALEEVEGVSTVWAWGAAAGGTLGNGTKNTGATLTEPIEVELPGHVIQIESGGGANFALTESEGTNVLYSWGSDKGKVLGIPEATETCEGEGTVKCESYPQKVEFPALPEGFKVVQVSGGLASETEVTSIYALVSNGNAAENKVFAWGANSKGGVGDGTTTERTTPVEVHLEAVEKEEKERLGLLVPSPIVSVAGGSGYGLALLEDGHVIGWGANKAGPLGPGTSEACLANGELCECKKTPASCDKLPQVVGGLEGVVELATGGTFNLARTEGGQVYGWGRNSPYGQLGIGDPLIPEECGTETNGAEEVVPLYCARTPEVLPTLEGVEKIGASFTGGMAVLPVAKLPAPVLAVTPEHNQVKLTWTNSLKPEGKYKIRWRWVNPETEEHGSFAPWYEQTTSCSVASPCNLTIKELEYRPYEIVFNTLEKTSSGTEETSYDTLPRDIVVTPLTPVLEVTGVSPSSGPEAGGNEVTIHGDNFEEGATVKFGSKSATGVTVVSPFEITAKVPGVETGATTVDVKVSETAGESPTSAADHYSYIAAPKVKKVEPIRSPASGGQIITIVGNNLEGASEVLFGTTPAVEIVSSNSTEVKVKTPALAVGNYDTYVTTPGGKSATSAGDTYKAAPSITSISPSSGTAAGGTKVTVKGNGLSGATFKVDGLKMKSVACGPGGTECEMTTPAHAAGGPFHVVATVSTIPSGETEADLFTYF